MKESLLVSSILKRIAPCLLALFAAVLGLCVNCRADSLSVYQQFDFAQYGGHDISFRTDPGSSSGLTLFHTCPDACDFIMLGRSINVPALPVGSVVTSATFSLVALSGSLAVGNGGAVISGTSQAQLNFLSVESLDDFGPCLPPSCAPTIATVSVAYTDFLGSNCLRLDSPCFATPTTGSFNLLSLGISPTDFADGFSIFAPQFDTLAAHGASIDTVLYPGFNSQTDYSFRGIGPQVLESVILNYTRVPEPATLMLLIPGLMALAALRLKKATA
jgi:hypothetical protein